MSKEEIFKMIEVLDDQLNNMQNIDGADIQTIQLFKDVRKMWAEVLLRDHGIAIDK